MNHCPSCGTERVRPDQRYCAKCGTSLAAPVEPPPVYGQPPRISGPLFADDLPPAPPAPPTQPVPSAPFAPAPLPPPAPPPLPPPAPPPPFAPAPPPPRRRRTAVVLLVAAALVAALVGAGVVVLLFAQDDEPTSGASAPDRRTSTGTGSPSTPATRSTTAAPPLFRCWNGGAEVARLASCPTPSGAAGMAWVFPSSAGRTCSVDAGAERATEAECYPVVDGEKVRFHYSEWRSRTALEAYYGGNRIGAIATPGGRGDLTALRVVSREPAVGYKVAIYYTDPAALWSVTIYAADEAEYHDAVADLVVRPFARLRGERG